MEQLGMFTTGSVQVIPCAVVDVEEVCGGLKAVAVRHVIHEARKHIGRALYLSKWNPFQITKFVTGDCTAEQSATIQAAPFPEVDMAGLSRTGPCRTQETVERRAMHTARNTPRTPSFSAGRSSFHTTSRTPT